MGDVIPFPLFRITFRMMHRALLDCEEQSYAFAIIARNALRHCGPLQVPPSTLEARRQRLLAILEAVVTRGAPHLPLPDLFLLSKFCRSFRRTAYNWQAGRLPAA